MIAWTTGSFLVLISRALTLEFYAVLRTASPAKAAKVAVSNPSNGTPIRGRILSPGPMGCFCARRSDIAAEAGVETAEAYRGRGYGQRVTVTWGYQWAN
jgi:hypothetical protein